MRAIGLSCILLLVAAAQWVVAPAQMYQPCCCYAAAESAPSREASCCGETTPSEQPGEVPGCPDEDPGCDCHIDPAPSAPPEASLTLPEASHAMSPPPVLVARLHSQTCATPPVDLHRPLGPPGVRRHLALCVFLI